MKSNRATLMWVLPYAVGIVLFAPDLVSFVLGATWRPAVVLLQGLAVVGVITQLGFNWFSFFRAHGDSGPPAVEATAGALAFVLLVPAGLLLDGFEGFAAGRIGAALVALAVRSIYVRRLLPDVRYRQLVGPSLIPIVLASAAVVVVRLLLWGGQRPLIQALAELALFAALYGVVAIRRERSLMIELIRSLSVDRAAPPRDGDVLPAEARAAIPPAGMQ